MPPRPHLPTTTTTSTTPLLPPLTLIVATTPITTPTNASSHRRLGIGHAGTLPWPRIKSDMTFFSRVTTRPPPPLSPPPSSPHERSAINAVIMGRKTYDSLPARFRPLPGRVNVVITRDVSGRERGRVEAEWRGARERERQRQRQRERDGGVGVDGMTGTNVPSTFTTTQSQSQSQPVSVPEADAEAEQTPDILVSNSLDSALTALADAFKPGPPAPGKLTRGGTRRLGAV
ncbi:dihydrofolate reductase, partial [Emmonsiellopsis sp. PD_33]